MRYGIFSDIHGNLQAWEAVLADMREMGVEVFVCLGDIVGYGPQPRRVLASVRALTTNVLMGNHDAAAAGLLDSSIFNAKARGIIDWTRRRLDEEALTYLAGLPLAIDAGEILFVHAEVEQPGRFGYIDGLEAARENLAAGNHRVTFIGHTHYPTVFVEEADGAVRELGDGDVTFGLERRYIVNAGSVGEPRDPDDIRGRYVIYDSDTEHLVFRRVEFDPEEYRAELLRSGLNISPYFLSVVDNHDAAVAAYRNAEALRALTRDMKVSAQVPTNRQGRVSTLVVPGKGGARKQDRSGKGGLLAAALGVVTLLAAAGGVVIAWPRPGEGSGKKEPAAASRVGNREGAPRPPEGAGEPVRKSVMAAAGKAQAARAPSLRGTGAARPARTVAHWHVDHGPDGMSGAHRLEVIRTGTPEAPLLDLGPGAGWENKAAVRGGAWGEAQPTGVFDLARDRSFTFEAWLATGPPGDNLDFLAGTRTNGKRGYRGWHLGFQRRSRPSVVFNYTAGASRKFVLAVEDEGVFDWQPHHLALVWDHEGGGDGAGMVRLYIDGAERESRIIGRDAIPGGSTGKSFKIGDRPGVGMADNHFPGTLDEVRFTEGVLDDSQFLTGGRGWIAGARPQEAPRQEE